MVDEFPNRDSNSGVQGKIQGYIGLTMLFSLIAALQIAKIAIGGQYMGDCDVVVVHSGRNDKDNMDVPTYLVINGAVTLGIDVLTMFCMSSDRGFMVMVGGNILSRISFLLYGSYLVIGYYGTWTHEKGGAGTYYCSFTPFMFAYIELVVCWVLITLSCCIGTCCCLNCCSGTKKFFQGRQPRTPTNLEI